MAVTSNNLILASDLATLAGLANSKSTLAGVPYSFPDLTYATNKFTGGTNLAASALSGIGSGLTVNATVGITGQVYLVVPHTSGTGFLTGDTITFADATGTGFIGTVVASAGSVTSIIINTPPHWMQEFNRLVSNVGLSLSNPSNTFAANHLFTDSVSKWPINGTISSTVSGILADDIDFYYPDPGVGVTVSSVWNTHGGPPESCYANAIPFVGFTGTSPWVVNLDISGLSTNTIQGGYNGGLALVVGGTTVYPNNTLVSFSFNGLASVTTTIPGATGWISGTYGAIVLPPTQIPDGSYNVTVTWTGFGFASVFMNFVALNVPSAPVAVPAIAGGTVYKISKCSAGLPLKITTTGQGNNLFTTNAAQLLSLTATTTGFFVGRCLQYDGSGYSALKSIANDRGDLMIWNRPTYVWKARAYYSINEYSVPSYNVGQTIQDTNGNTQMVTASGFTGSTQPAWATATNATTNDGTVTWKNLGPNQIPLLKSSLASCPRWPYFKSTDPTVILPGETPNLTSTLPLGSGVPVIVQGWFVFSLSLNRLTSSVPISVDVGVIRSGVYVSFGTFMTGTTTPVMWPIFTKIPLTYVCPEAIDLQASVCNMETQIAAYYTGLPGFRKQAFAYPMRADSYNYVETALGQIT